MPQSKQWMTNSKRLRRLSLQFNLLKQNVIDKAELNNSCGSMTIRCCWQWLQRRKAEAADEEKEQKAENEEEWNEEMQEGNSRI